jgi:hypothetical protein
VRPVTRLKTNDPVLDRIQGNVAASVDPMTRVPIVAGQQLTGVALTAAGPTEVPHRLNRKLAGWWITRLRDGAAVVWDDQDANLAPERTLILRCTIDCTVDLWVYRCPSRSSSCR